MEGGVDKTSGETTWSESGIKNTHKQYDNKYSNTCERQGTDQIPR